MENRLRQTTFSRLPSQELIDAKILKYAPSPDCRLYSETDFSVHGLATGGFKNSFGIGGSLSTGQAFEHSMRINVWGKQATPSSWQLLRFEPV